MSTLPHDARHSADAAPVIATIGNGQQLDALFHEFEAAAEEVGMSRPAATELRELCRQVADISQRIFPGEVSFKLGRDWELPDDIYFLVDVWTSGTPDEVVAKASDWHLAMHEAAGRRWRLFCLSFHVV